MHHRQLIVAVMVGLLVVSNANAQDCRPSGDQRYSWQRREAAVRYLERLHAAELQSQTERGRFVPLHELSGLGSPPVGFVPRLVLDQWSYLVRLIDVFDPCGFALFLDDQGVIYEAHPQAVRGADGSVNGARR